MAAFGEYPEDRCRCNLLRCKICNPEPMMSQRESYQRGYNAGKRESKWISVEDELPKCSVLILLVNHIYETGYVRKIGNHLMWISDSDNTPCGYVENTYWQPLPDAPG